MPDLGEKLPSRLIELTAEQASTINVGTSDTDSNPIFLGKWQLNQPVTSPKQDIRFVHGAVNAIMKKDSGAGAMKFGFLTSADGINFDDAFIQVTASIGSEQANSTGTNANFIPNTRLFFAIIAYNSDGGTTGTVRNSIATVTLQLPPQYTVTRLI